MHMHVVGRGRPTWLHLHAGMQQPVHVHHPDFFVFLPFLRKNLTIRPLLERIQKMDPKLGAVPRGAEVTRLGAVDLGA
jgi:hypothetical protein